MMTSTLPHSSPQRDFASSVRRRSSVKSLLNSANPPASPLDALVMALEATVEDVEAGFDLDLDSESLKNEPEQDDDDPDATIPSSPTMFMKRPANGPSLHNLPTMLLPAPASTMTTPTTPTTASPKTPQTSRCSSNGASTKKKQEVINRRKMSISSEDSASSVVSARGRGLDYTCSVAHCEKQFSQAEDLSSHERLDVWIRNTSGAGAELKQEQNYDVCRFDGCERSFTQLGNLKTHERKHTGERPYKCPHPECDKTFTQLGNLKTHERIHDEVKPFMCRLVGCGKTFSQLGNLKTHTVKMHPDVTISDEELAIRTTSNHYRKPEDRRSTSPNAPRLLPSQENGVVQVVAHFNPYQRRPIKPQHSEEEKLLRKIRAMIQHEQRVRELEDASEVSDDIEE
ncbi:hypothetical protein BGZ83_007546 [Gryganskiella cystojenkinii]|nr:hypothetical protein BGZ83_007546 [Gryganskiella cystojenkinii]